MNKGTNENNQAVVYETSSETENQIRDSQSLTDGFGQTENLKDTIAVMTVMTQIVIAKVLLISFKLNAHLHKFILYVTEILF